MELEQQSDSPVTIYGSDMPRLLKRIEEEHRKGRFKEKPMGPLGMYIKIKDPTWTPAVEKYLGANILGGFAVDNGQDAKILGVIINEIYRGQRPPNIVASKFFNRVRENKILRINDFFLRKAAHLLTLACLLLSGSRRQPAVHEASELHQSSRRYGNI